MNSLQQKIRALRAATNLDQEAFGDAVGVDQSTVSRWERGKSVPDYPRRVRLADLAHKTIGEEARPSDFVAPVSVAEDNPELIAVTGIVEAGRLVSAAQLDEYEQFFISLPEDPRYPGAHRQAFVVRGPSMNLVLPEGSIVICVNPMEIGRDAIPGEFVVARRNVDEELFEITLKEFRMDEDGQPWLWPRSAHPAHQAPLRLPKPAIEDDTDEILVVGIVTGSFRIEGPLIAPPRKNGR